MTREAARQWSLPWSDYQLLDAGDGRKLERFGQRVLIRPDINATEAARWPQQRWRELAQWQFVEESKNKGCWQPLCAGAARSDWQIHVLGVQATLSLTPFKHIGIFPEQISNWHSLTELAPGSRLLNLFAYTGLASLIARATGAEVVHVDSVKQLISWARGNMEASKLSDIRWVHEDALKFAEREARRGRRYDAIVMDPPAFGLGANGEKWILEQKLPQLLATASELLAERGRLILNTYSPKITTTTLRDLARATFAEKQFHVRELWVQAESGTALYYGNVLHVVR